MKKLFYTMLLSAILFSFTKEVFSQISYGGEPYSFKETLASRRTISGAENIKTIRVKDLDMNVVNQELEEFNSCKDCNSGFYYGKEVDINVDFFEQATKYSYSEEENVWILKFESNAAKGYQFIFDEFYLPFGSKLFIYNEDKSMLLGAFTSENNREDQTFLTQYINGENIYIEYIQPKSETESNKIFIKKVVYIFTDTFTHNSGPFSHDDGAAKCHINTSCPEGEELDIEIKSTVMILEKASLWGDYWGICTGTLINDGFNYQAKQMPYLVTANHCYENMGEGTFNDTYNWLFLFRHEASDCNSDGADVSNSTTKSALGARVLARDDGSKTSDYLLLELSNSVKEISKFDIAFAGYDLNNYFVDPGSFISPLVGVHHPKGDIKKLSISTKPAESIGVKLGNGGNFNIIKGDNHWHITATKGFKTEPASSGSALFDSNHRLIGTCRGGDNTITCSSNRNLFKTVYGKFSEAGKNQGIRSYLMLNIADPYIPKSIGNEESLRIYPSVDNTVVDYSSPKLYCNITSDYREDNEEAIVKCIVYKNPFDYKKYGPPFLYYDSRYYYDSQVLKLVRRGHSTKPYGFTEYTFNIPEFKEKGDYKAIIIVSRSSDQYENPTVHEFTITITDAGTCKCGTFDFDISNPKKKYAPGSTIIARESADFPNTVSYSTFTPDKNCYSGTRDRCGNWQPKYIGVAKRTWSLNKKIISTEIFNTALPYIQTNPGRYYTSGTRRIYLEKAGVYRLQVLLNLSFRYETIRPDRLECLPPRPNTHFESFVNLHQSHAYSGSAKIIVADCTGYKIVKEETSPLLSIFSSDEKEVGVGSIDIDNIRFNANKSYAVEAYKSITLKPGTIIPSGTSFSAKIVSCPSVTKSATIETRSDALLYEKKKSDNISNSIAAYPNPTTGIVNIGVLINEDIVVYEAEIYDLNGRLIRNKNSITNPYSFDISNQPNGVYIVRLFSNKGVSSHKVILRK